MVTCAIHSCHNQNKNVKNNEIKFFTFPKDKRIADEWIKICGREDKINLKTARVCSLHFTASCIPLKYRLLKDESFRGRGLIPDAIPTENLFVNSRSDASPILSEYKDNKTSIYTTNVNTAWNNVSDDTIGAEDNENNIEPCFTQDLVTNYNSELNHSKTYRCNHCDKTYDTFEQLQEHIPMHLNVKRKSKCRLCGKLCVTLKQHIIKMHPEFDSLACKICNAKFTTKSKLRRHIVSYHTNDQYLCDICGAMFTNAAKFKEHNVTHSNLRPFSCVICGKAYKTRSVLRIHSRIHLRHTQTYEYTCKTCGKLFNSAVTLKAHTSIHENVNRYKCELCSRSFYRKRILAVHLRVHTGERPYECNECGMKFKYNSNYKRHLSSHKNLKPFICEHCGTAFKQLVSLQNHLKVHLDVDNHVIEKDANGITKINGTTVYTCELCEMVFTTNIALRAHVRLHCGSYKCNQCNKRFISPTSLNRHMKTIHSEIKAYKCTQCQKWFNLYTRYKLHIESHTRKPLKCDLCGKRYALKAWLIGHKQKYHYSGEAKMKR